MINQLLTHDPFERDALMMDYHKWGNRVGEARNALRARLDDERSLALMERQDELIPRTVELQDRVVDLAARDAIEPAMRIVRNELFDLDRQFDGVIQELRRHEQAIMQAAIDRARDTAETARRFMLWFGIGGILFAAILMLTTRRTFRRLQHELHEQAEQLDQASERLHYESRHDALTGLLNRRAFYEQAAHCQRDGGSFALAYIDLDCFKPVNDEHGHAIGDDVLTRVGERLQAAAGESGIVARLGGDEFCLLVPDDEGLAEHEAALRAELERPLTIDGRQIDPRLSIGWARCPADGTDLDELITRADGRMYAQKGERRRGPAERRGADRG
ncbi:GGDEF domain-containing protein [Guyparkeria hydrothermalis]|uniref:diguanylate cyclase domain-containing protein n=1 Tax=Guyparkeria TaxID=2035712 RepID=UPI0010AD9B89|nr:MULTISPECIES: diguanylate cyclase [Guyparkeria]MCL7751170.1 GGDEF domain-containing protein [Guyparkeria hydrothermalis]TKA88354.1 GGDEF domain-containing protein [Guyparkeria sp. SB14A]